MTVLIRPIISEKSLTDAKFGKYTFEVLKSADKSSIKNDVEKTFNVKVKGVFTNITKGGKTKRTRFGIKSVPFSYKKARVQLARDQKIDIFEESVGDDKKSAKKDKDKKDKKDKK